jgi:Zn-dependent protease with chaperone function
MLKASMLEVARQPVKRLPKGMRLIAPYLALPGVVLAGLLVIIGPDVWGAFYAWGKGVCQMYLADLSLARVALELGKLLAATATVAILAVMLREGRRLRLLGRILERADCTAVSAETRSYPVTVVDDAVPFAFCRGILRPRIYFSTRLERLLTAEELEAVLAHEEVHARRRDPLRTLIAHMVAASLFPVPLSRVLRDRYLAWLEISADREVVGKSGPGPLAGALLKLIQHSAIRSIPSSTPLVRPFSGLRAGSFNVTEERVKRLLGGGDASRPSLVPVRYLLANGAMVASAGLVSMVMVYGVGLFFQTAPLCEVTGSVL